MNHHHHVSMLVCVLWGPVGLGGWITFAALAARRHPSTTNELES
jgi:hypothetical protein